MSELQEEIEAAALEEAMQLLEALCRHDEDYAALNNLHNADGSPATFNELNQARAFLSKHKDKDNG